MVRSASFLFVLGLATLSNAVDLGAIKKQIQAQENKFSVAVTKKDFKTINRLMTSDFISITPDGTLHSKKESLSDLQEELNRTVRFIAVSSVIQSVKIKDGKADVISNNKLVAVMKLKGKTGTLTNAYQSHEIWVRKNSMWVISLSQELKGGKAEFSLN
jgi:hypothetical protein